jgi:hypothetical protein
MAEDFFCRSCSLGYGMDFGLCIAVGIWIWIRNLHCWSLGVEDCILAGLDSSIVSGGGGEYTLASPNNSVSL